MRLEIRSASHFLSDLLRLGHSLSDHQLDLFRGTLEDLLQKHYQHHWFPERPARGSGYRCIRINHKMDPLLARAAQACGVNDSSVIRNMFPSELTLWIDPREVSYRIGENGSICVLYDAVVDARPQRDSHHQGQQLQQVHHQRENNSVANNHHHHQERQQHHHHHQNQHGGQMMSASLDRYSTCKESVRGFDQLILDNRNMNLVEQFTPYVSS